jgi:hypothetical protein
MRVVDEAAYIKAGYWHALREYYTKTESFDFDTYET